MARQQLYYPVSDIETNLYASKNMFSLETGTSYIGLYHRYISTGEYYTGGVWNEKTSKKLIPYKPDEPADVKLYKTLTSIQTKFKTPYSVPANITAADITKGYIIRYILFKNNDRIIIETDLAQYEQWQRKQIDNNIYNAITVNWRISGELNSVTVNGVKTLGVIEQNTKTFKMLQSINSAIATHFSNPLQFYVDTSIIIPPDIN